MTTLLLADPNNPSCIISERGRMRTRLSARLRSHALDRALAAGVSPDSSAALSLRAHALIEAGARGTLARSIRRVTDNAVRPFGPLSPGIPTCRRKILASREGLEALAARLEAGDPVDVRGVAMVAVLLTDGGGPIYERPGANDLEPALRQALKALDL
jgi:hypothetical protein